MSQANANKTPQQIIPVKRKIDPTNREESNAKRCHGLSAMKEVHLDHCPIYASVEGVNTLPLRPKAVKDEVIPSQPSVDAQQYAEGDNNHIGVCPERKPFRPPPERRHARGREVYKGPLFVCDDCPSELMDQIGGFATQAALKFHWVISHGPRNLSCPHVPCTMKFALSYQVGEHCFLEHGWRERGMTLQECHNVIERYHAKTHDGQQGNDHI